MHRIIPFVLLAGFISLAVYSYPQPQGYSTEAVTQVNFLASNEPDCGLDWLCLIAQAEQQHPKHKHR